MGAEKDINDKLDLILTKLEGLTNEVKESKEICERVHFLRAELKECYQQKNFLQEWANILEEKCVKYEQEVTRLQAAQDAS